MHTINSLRSPNPMVRLAVGALPFIFVNFLAYAGVDCPGRISADKPRRTMTDTVGHMPLDKPVILEYKGVLYRIPVGYMYAWPSTKGPKGFDPDKVQRANRTDLENLDFAFWMPSLRYPERNPVFTPSFRPCENGRPPATPDQAEYIVHVRLEPFRQLADGRFLTPFRMFKNITSNQHNGSGEQAFSFTKEYGLLRFAHKSAPSPFVNYRNLNGSGSEVLFRCTKLEGKARNPLCDGYAYFPDKDLYLYMVFSTQDLPHWREMLDAAQTLLERWHVKDTQDLK